MKQVDLNFDGVISFTEFLVATCNKRMLFTDHNLRELFNFIDKNRDGIVDLDDLQSFLGLEIPEDEVKKILRVVGYKNFNCTFGFDELRISMAKIITN